MGHLNWLLPRIPQTKDLSLVGLEFNMTVSALNTCNCPLLQELNLSFVANLTDAAIHKLLSAPRDSRPGLMDKKSRLKQLRKLSWKITDGGMAMLGTPDASSTEQLTGLDVSSCRGLTDSGLQHLQRCKNLTRLDATNTHISAEGLTKFASSSKHRLKCFSSVVDKKPETKRKRK